MITLRKNKQAPLTCEELDGNFIDLEERLKKLEQNSQEADPLTKIEEKDGHIIFIGSKGKVLGTVSPPLLHIAFKGAWKENIPYLVNDMIAHGSDILICKVPHVAKKFTKKNWDVVLSIPSLSKSSQQKPLKIETHPTLPCFDEAKVPKKAKLGKLIVCIGSKVKLLLGDGQKWNIVKIKED